MNRQLAKAVVAAFRDPDGAAHRKHLSSFCVRDWQNTLPWLDTSGLALYFLIRLKSLSSQDVIPSSILLQLEQRLADNTVSTATIFQEFVRLNRAFQQVSLTYLNLKGFTLVPDYCPAAALRYQLDCDFLVAEADRKRCEDVLNGLGYTLAFESDRVMEFKAGMSRVPRLSELYKPKLQRSVEIHLIQPESSHIWGLDSGALERCRTVTLNDFSFPALSSDDLFIAQAFHLLRHVRSEWTRISWILELRNFVLSRRQDISFWLSIERLCRRIHNADLAVGMAMRLAAEAFGGFAMEHFGPLQSITLPATAELWIQRYVTSVLLSEYPGTKLYLLLNSELHNDEQMSRSIRKTLLPPHFPPRITLEKNGDFRGRFIAIAQQLSYVLFRLRFHVKEDSRYLLEAWRWKHLLAKQPYSPASSNHNCTVNVDA